MGTKGPKYEREVRDILKQLPEFLPEDEPHRTPKGSGPGSRGFPSWPLSAWLAAAGVALLLVGILVRSSSSAVSFWLAVVSVACFVGAYVASVVVARRSREEVRWRGRVIHVAGSEPQWKVAIGQFSWRVRAWLRRRGR